MSILHILLLPFLTEAASRENKMIALEKTTTNDGLNAMVLRAREWLKTYGEEDPDQAGMEELRTTNPDAYAIVQALITKKSLGLLNPRHPNAFGGMLDAPGQAGAMSTKVVEDPPVAPMSAVSTQTDTHKDYFNWKPHVDDDAMVSDVLGAAPPAKNAGVDTAASVEAVRPQPEAESVAPKATTPVEHAEEPRAPTNPYLQNVAPTASMSQEASSVKYGKGSGQNLLSSFSWDDNTPAAPVAQQAAASVTPKTGNALENFLR